MQETDNILRGYTTQQTAYEVKNYHYGFRLRTSIFYWIETKKGVGDRFCRYTINPKTGKANKPKYSTYSPFLYLQLDENNHVTTGTLSAYHVDIFQARFYFILKNLYPFYISQDQQHNIRMDYLAHVIGAMPWKKVKYSADTAQDYKNWCDGIIKYIKTCPFENLVEYPEAPEPDQPEAERQLIVSTVECTEPVDPVHTITADKIKSLVEKAIPNFLCEVSEYTIFGTYFKILIAVPKDEKKMHSVSLSLNIKTLKLQPQSYGGQGGQCIYREPNREDPKEKWLAMKSVKIPFRTPARNEKDVLSAIQRFAVNYKNTLIENVNVLADDNKDYYRTFLNVAAPCQQ